MIPNQYRHLSHVDILVVGAGATGLYLGVRHKESRSDKKIIIVEQQSRIGGMIDSLEFVDGTPFAAEKCALRYLPQQTLVQRMIEKYSIETFEYANDKVATSTPVPVINQLVNRIPPSDPKLSTYSNLSEILQTPTMCKGDYNNLYTIEGGTGYSINAYPQSLLYFYNATAGVSTPIQYFLKGGFMSLIDHMYEDIKDSIDLFLNTRIDTIIYSEILDKYIVNNKWMTSKIVYTGVVGDMVQLQTDSTLLQESRNMVLDNMGTYMRTFRLYLIFDNPWWSEEDISLYFRSLELPIGNMFYFTKNTIQIYTDMTRADILYEFIPIDLKDDDLEWKDPSKYPDLVAYATSMIAGVINEAFDQGNYPASKMPTESQLTGISHVALKYTKEAVLNYESMRTKQWETYLPKINSNDSIHLLSSNYFEPSGWVDTCFACVEENLDEVLG